MAISASVLASTASVPRPHTWGEKTEKWPDKAGEDEDEDGDGDGDAEEDGDGDRAEDGDGLCVGGVGRACFGCQLWKWFIFVIKFAVAFEYGIRHTAQGTANWEYGVDGNSGIWLPLFADRMGPVAPAGGFASARKVASRRVVSNWKVEQDSGAVIVATDATIIDKWQCAQISQML